MTKTSKAYQLDFWSPSVPLCFCGCGEPVNRYRERMGWDKFKLGHSKRVVWSRNQRKISLPDAPLCACGCGSPTYFDIRKNKWNLFITGHNQRGKRLSEEQCQYISFRLTGKKASDLTRKKLSESHIGKGLGRVVSIEVRNKMSRSQKGKNIGKPSAFKGRHHSEENKIKQSIRVKALWQDKQWREACIRASVLGQLKKPTRPEKRFIDLCANNGLPYRYNSIDVDLMVGGKIPDFYEINGKKEVVEVFGRYFHSLPRAPYSQTEIGRLEHFNSRGYECIILWDDEDDDAWLRKVLPQ